MTDVAALYIDPLGCYPEIVRLHICAADGCVSVKVDCWDETRDARLYDGPHPVVAHPPCARWCGFARLNERRYGIPVGSDGGCFAAALASVRSFGGVLEHPAGSLAWAAFGLPRPGVAADSFGGYTVEIMQVEWGCPARKRTWLYLVGVPLGALEPPPYPGARATHQIGWFDRAKPTLSKRDGSRTPRAFAEYLIRLAWGAHV